MSGDFSCEHTIYSNWIRPGGVQKWESNAHVCAASAAMATGRQDIAFEELDAATNDAVPSNVVALLARATWMSATRGVLVRKSSCTAGVLC